MRSQRCATLSLRASDTEAAWAALPVAGLSISRSPTRAISGPVAGRTASDIHCGSSAMKPARPARPLSCHWQCCALSLSTPAAGPGCFRPLACQSRQAGRPGAWQSPQPDLT
jgi:hypothetical protein